MITLMNMEKCYHVTAQKKAADAEILKAMLSSDDHGIYIHKNIETIIRNKLAMNEECAAKKPDKARIARYNSNIDVCISSVKSHLMKLGGTQQNIDEIVKYIKEEDYKQTTLSVLKLMARKNPGLNQRKYDMALQMVANSQKQH